MFTEYAIEAHMEEKKNVIIVYINLVGSTPICGQNTIQNHSASQT